MAAPRIKPISTFIFTLPVPAACALAAALTSRDFFCVPIGAAVLSIVIVALLETVWNIERLYHWKHVRKVQFATFLLLVLFFGATFRSDKQALFRAAFGSDVPPGVRNLVLDRNIHLVGDLTVLMRFQADPQDMDLLLARGEFHPSDVFERALAQKQEWDRLLRTAFISSVGFIESGGSAWTHIAPMVDPVCRVRGLRDKRGGGSLTEVLWDRATGQAYVIYGWD